MTRRQKGFLILSIPFIFVVLILLSFVVINTLLGAAVPGSVSSSIHLIPQAFANDPAISIPGEVIRSTRDDAGIVTLMRTIINFVLGFSAILCITFSLICIPLGLYYIFTPNHKATDLRKYPELEHLTDEQLESIDRLSWGAFFGSFLWPLSTGLYLWALGVFLPIINLYVFFKLWIHGRRMSWIALKPTSFQEFQERQRTAALIIGGFYFLSIGLYFFFIYQYIL